MVSKGGVHMRYIKVKWIHSSSKNPIWLYSELDDDRWEVRKVEIYPDGIIDYAGPNGETGSTLLGIVPVPLLEEINTDPEFIGNEITADEFENIWKKALIANDNMK